MAAVTVVTSNSTVIGSRRMYNATVTVATSGDTLTIPGFKTIDSVVTTPATAIAAGVTKSGAVVTFLSAASNPTQVMAVGI
jgi:hypothetical protein